MMTHLSKDGKINHSLLWSRCGKDVINMIAAPAKYN